jgi:hypothetical protein
VAANEADTSGEEHAEALALEAPCRRRSATRDWGEEVTARGIAIWLEGSREYGGIGDGFRSGQRGLRGNLFPIFSPPLGCSHWAQPQNRLVARMGPWQNRGSAQQQFR